FVTLPAGLDSPSAASASSFDPNEADAGAELELEFSPANSVWSAVLDGEDGFVEFSSAPAAAAHSDEPAEAASFGAWSDAARQWLLRRLPVEAGPLVRWVTVAWACGAALLLGRWLVGYLGLWRLLRQTEPAPASVAQLL